MEVLKIEVSYSPPAPAERYLRSVRGLLCARTSLLPTSHSREEPLLSPPELGIPPRTFVHIPVRSPELSSHPRFRKMNEFIPQLIFEHRSRARNCSRRRVLFSWSLFLGWGDR